MKESFIKGMLISDTSLMEEEAERVFLTLWEGGFFNDMIGRGRE